MELHDIQDEQDLDKLVEEHAQLLLEEEKQKLVKAYVNNKAQQEISELTKNETDYILETSNTDKMEVLGRIYDILNKKDKVQERKNEENNIKTMLTHTIYYELENLLFYKLEQKVEDIPDKQKIIESL